MAEGRRLASELIAGCRKSAASFDSLREAAAGYGHLAVYAHSDACILVLERICKKAQNYLNLLDSGGTLSFFRIDTLDDMQVISMLLVFIKNELA